MSTPFTNAARSMLAALKGAAGVEVTYNGGSSFAEAVITAVPSSSVLESTDSRGVTTLVTTFDWIIASADLGVLGNPPRPERGHLIIRYGGDGLNVLVGEYEVLDPPYKPMDAEGIMLRIHTKKIRELTA